MSEGGSDGVSEREEAEGSGEVALRGSSTLQSCCGCRLKDGQEVGGAEGERIKEEQEEFDLCILRCNC